MSGVPHPASFFAEGPSLQGSSESAVRNGSRPRVPGRWRRSDVFDFATEDDFDGEKPNMGIFLTWGSFCQALIRQHSSHGPENLGLGCEAIRGEPAGRMPLASRPNMRADRRIRTHEASCASSARLRDDGPILQNGVAAVAFVGSPSPRIARRRAVVYAAAVETVSQRGVARTRPVTRPAAASCPRGPLLPLPAARARSKVYAPAPRSSFCAAPARCWCAR
jgi:hypothetical protein